MAMRGIRLWKCSEEGVAEYYGTDAWIVGDAEDRRERLEHYYGKGAELVDVERVVCDGTLVGIAIACGPEEERSIKEAIECAGLYYDTFRDGFDLTGEVGFRRAYGGWDPAGGDWIVAGNTYKEIEKQLNTLAWEEQLRVESNDNN